MDTVHGRAHADEVQAEIGERVDARVRVNTGMKREARSPAELPLQIKRRHWELFTLFKVSSRPIIRLAVSCPREGMHAN